MNLAFSVTDNYVDYMATTLLSILQHTTDKIDAYILTSHLSAYSRLKLNRLQLLYDNLTCHIIDVNVTLFEKLPLNRDHIKTFEAYFRLAFPSLLPDTVEKIIYLDCDLLIQNDLKTLWAIDFSGYYMAGVREPFSQGAHEYRCKIGMTNTKNYVNSGVLLIDLKKMREDNIQQLLFDCADEIKDKILLQDQDIINVALDGNIFPLPQTYNYIHMFKGDVIDDSQMAIIHFALVKPWDKLADVYEYKRRSIDAYYQVAKTYQRLIEPLVTIVVSIYQVDNLQNALACLQQQNYKNIEIVLLDNVQSDETKRLCDLFCAQDHRFRYYRLRDNQKGIVSGIEKVLGDYVFFINTQSILTSSTLSELFTTMIEKQQTTCLIVDVLDDSDCYHGTSFVEKVDRTQPFFNNILNGYLIKTEELTKIIKQSVLTFDCLLSRFVLLQNHHLLTVYLSNVKLRNQLMSLDSSMSSTQALLYSEQLRQYQIYTQNQHSALSNHLVLTLQNWYEQSNETEDKLAIRQNLMCLKASYQ